MSDYSGMSRPQLVAEHRQLSAQVEALKDKYQRDVFGLNNEGDPIGGDPAGGYVNDLARLKTENESLRKDAELGRIAMKYFDRLDDPSDCDPMETSVAEFLAAIRAAISSPENH